MAQSGLVSSLIIDDSATMRSAIKSVLQSIQGCDIVGEGANGFEAIELARALRPRLVVMDIHMPELGGMEALQRLKSEFPSMHVVMVSTAVDPETRTKALDAGANACLEKGLDMADSLRQQVLTLAQIVEPRKPTG